MTDVFTPQQRHAMMAAIRGKNTKPEILVRRFLWANGYRYRVNDKRLPGKPDIVMRKYRVCIFVNGCFWHGHEGCKYYTLPKSNTEFWQDKARRNKERDARVTKELSRMGWSVIVLWECMLKPARRDATLAWLDVTLNDIFLSNHSKVTAYKQHETSHAMAAEKNRYDA